MQTSECCKTLEQILVDNGVETSHPDFGKLWECFKQFAKIPFECADDALLFETSPWSFGGISCLLCTMTRQFTIEDGGEYDHMEQMQINLYYPSAALPGVPAEAIWSDECGVLASFWKAAESSTAFQALQNGPMPVKMECCLDEL